MPDPRTETLEEALARAIAAARKLQALIADSRTEERGDDG
jgi:hypothetical protein